MKERKNSENDRFRNDMIEKLEMEFKRLWQLSTPLSLYQTVQNHLQVGFIWL